MATEKSKVIILVVLVVILLICIWWQFFRKKPAPAAEPTPATQSETQRPAQAPVEE
jgi:flagellar basal body-associated protein FliL